MLKITCYLQQKSHDINDDKIAAMGTNEIQKVHRLMQDILPVLNII